MNFNQQLQNELLAMYEEDQQVLQSLVDSGDLGTTEYHPKMKAIHEKNNARIKNIIKQYGWPGFSLVGKEGSHAAWLIVQHAVLDTQFMNKVLPILKQAINQNDAESWCFAYLQDRSLTMAGELQIYGTQHDTDANGIVSPLAIKEPERVAELRKEIGLEPLTEVTKQLQERHDEIINNRK